MQAAGAVRLVIVVPVVLLAGVLWLWHGVDTSVCERSSSPCTVIDDQRMGADPLAPDPIVP